MHVSRKKIERRSAARSGDAGPMYVVRHKSMLALPAEATSEARRLKRQTTFHLSVNPL